MIRLIIMVFVVGVHTLAFGGGEVTLALGAITTVFHTSRELFFLLTALVLVYNYGRRGNVNWLRFWRRRYWLVIPAYVTWSLVYFVADGRWRGSPGAVAASFGAELLDAGAMYHLYFLLITMQVYAVFPVLRWVLRKTEGHHGLLFGLACAYQLALSAALRYRLGAYLAPLLSAVHCGWLGGLLDGWLSGAGSGLWLESYVLYVLGGAIAGWHFERICAVTRRYASAVSVTVAAGAGAAAGVGVYLAQVLAGGATPAAASAVFQPVVVFEALCFGWALLAGGLLWSDRGAPGRKFFAAGSASSFGIYLGHPLVLQFALWLAADSGFLTAVRGAGWALETAALLGLFLPVVYAGAWVIASAARRTPLSLALTGREYDRRKSP
jgi:peptidoglycan/LPS O-acetylase OafA/YrhL